VLIGIGHPAFLVPLADARGSDRGADSMNCKVTIGEKSFGGHWQVLWRAWVGAMRDLGGFLVKNGKVKQDRCMPE
jgi:hypothetical protein